MIHLSHITKSYGARKVLDDVSGEISEGSGLALLGPSGAGKSTLLHLIAGFEPPDQGEIRIQAEIVSTPAACVPPRARGIGIAFQRPALWPHMTVAENIVFALNAQSRSERAARLAELLAALDIEALAARRPHTLSGGEAQRAALARALAHAPDILLLDEPFAHLDEQRRQMVIARLQCERARRPVTMIIASHDEPQTATLCTRTLRLLDGRRIG
ncbi:MAG: ATP-binding cassette domain-containing protein [Vicinamibacteria bacterium]|jgi:iron(III) transport system ATP-binding protein|nr:ATP-binding cassette domain-containing protein [Vicinamibacteria bacterium]